jgi:hypothetical protein
MEALSVRRPDLPRALVQPDIPRSLVGSAGTQSQVNTSMCRDDLGKTYSLGAMVGIRNEPGRFARCMNGLWIEAAAR